MVNDSDDVFDQLRLQYEPTIVNDGIDFDELERLSYEPGVHERQVKALDKAEPCPRDAVLRTSRCRDRAEAGRSRSSDRYHRMAGRRP